MNDTTSPRPFCFVLMPFSSEFDDIYNLGIKDACKEAGTYCERVDEQIFNESILDRVFNQIAKADVVIADMTGKNPNVFYEVGYAHALGKTTILLTQRTEDIPFDLKHFPHIVYNSRITFLKEELKKRLAWFITHPTEKPEEKLDIDIFIGQRNLSAEKVTVTGSYTAENYGAIILNFVFHNKSSFTFASGDFKVGILCSKRILSIYESSQRATMVDLPDGAVLAFLPYFETLFPSAYTDYKARITFRTPEQLENITLKLFSTVGIREYHFDIEFIKKQ